MSSLLEPVVLGDNIQLRNRVCMASLTRNRCVDDKKPTEAACVHYGTRARDGTGLIVNEGTFISPSGTDWPHAPVLFTEEHARAWKRVTDAVHLEGGKIFYQAWHAGRCQHEDIPMLKDNNHPILAPSKIKASGGKYRMLKGSPGHTENITKIKDPREVVEQYRHSVNLAKNAGFDGVELLSQGGYLPHQFLSSRANKRTDAYGGSVENRCRFILEVVDAISEAWGYRGVGVKICPADHLNDSVVSFEEMRETYTHLVKQLVARKVGYISLTRRGVKLESHEGDLFGLFRPKGYDLPLGYEPIQDFGPMIKYEGSPTLLMVGHEYSVSEAETLVRERKIDLVAFGRPYIYNPDVITRIREGIPFATNDRGDVVYYGPYKSPNENYNDWPRRSA
ncbi:hypothetical protein BJ170DRAFT_679837 [Xylariales sp. AK1849]|nr:hypothetical protein BJ170DRAFT_679837 [Xylariales sp. AK1849]